MKLIQKVSTELRSRGIRTVIPEPADQAARASDAAQLAAGRSPTTERVQEPQGIERGISVLSNGASWYRHKRTVSVADMLTALRRALLAAQYRDGHPDRHTLDLFPDALLTGLEPAA